MKRIIRYIFSLLLLCILVPTALSMPASFLLTDTLSAQTHENGAKTLPEAAKVDAAQAEAIPEAEAATEPQSEPLPEPAPPQDAVTAEAAEQPVISLLEDGTYNGSVPTSLGELTYYNQHDTRWADYLWGGKDPLTSYGCGPTALAMLVTSFTEHSVTPPDTAAWAADNGYYSPGGGSHHNLIPEGLSAFGLKVESLPVHTPESIHSALNFGKILVLLMGPGHFTDKGHFIILTGTTPDGLVNVVDPQSLENSLIPWDASLILQELKNCGYGGPIWAVSKQP